MSSNTLAELLHKPWLVYCLGILLSVTLSIWLTASETVINPDGICYLASAADIASAGLQAAAQLCDQAKWPFYSALIFGVEQGTHLSYATAAYTLDGLLSLISVVSFIYLVRLLGGSIQTLWLAAAIILFAHEFDTVREYIVRDHGYWAFYLVSLVCLLQYFRQPRWYFAWGWSLSMLAATLFRIEGALFILFLPLAVLLATDRCWLVRVRQYAQLNLLLLLGILAAGVWLLFFSGRQAAHLGRLMEVQAQLLHGVLTLQQNFQQAAHQLAAHVLSPYAANQAGVLLFLLLASWYGYSLLAALTFIYVLLIAVAWKNKLLQLDTSARCVLWGYVAVNFIITAVYLAENLFISKRYLVAMTLVLMLWAPFALAHLLQTRRQHKLFFAGIIILLLANAVSGLYHFGASKNYIHEAGTWLEQNVPENAVLYSNDEQVMYYSRHFGNNLFAAARANEDLAAIAHGQWKHYDYLALRLVKQQRAANPALQEINSSPVQVFANRRGDAVLIYRIVH
jgi:hypothetical protein